MAGRENKEFELRGVNHLALVCKDMARTVDFYSNVLGMPLTKTLDLPAGMGQHFFFDIEKCSLRASSVVKVMLLAGRARDPEDRA